jgi:CDP-diacylglycerol--glycerol-3-phosphate 3-phosphatidyltransferase
MIPGRAQAYRAIRPLVAAAGAAGLSPDQLTVLGLLLSVGAAFAASRGAWGLAGLLLLAGGLCDMLDGELARSTGRASPAGAFLDSNLDRLGEAALLFGVAAGLPDRRGVFAALAALVASLLVSYARARGEGLGVDCPPFGWERPHRLIVLLVALLAAPVLPPGRALQVLTLAAAAVAVGAGVTAAGRIVVIQRILRAREGPGAEPRA